MKKNPLYQGRRGQVQSESDNNIGGNLVIPREMRSSLPLVTRLSIVFIGQSDQQDALTTLLTKERGNNESANTAPLSLEEDEQVPYAPGFEESTQDWGSGDPTGLINRQGRLWLEVFSLALRSYYRESDLPLFSTLIMDIAGGRSYWEAFASLQEQPFQWPTGSEGNFSGPRTQALNVQMQAFLTGPRALYLEARMGQALDLLTWIPGPIVELWFRRDTPERDEGHLIEAFFRPLLHGLLERNLTFEMVTTQITYLRDGAFRNTNLPTFLQEIGLIEAGR